MTTARRPVLDLMADTISGHKKGVSARICALVASKSSEILVANKLIFAVH